jgi:HK97 gp10 family phage protein
MRGFKLNVRGVDEMLGKFDIFDKETRVAVREAVRKSANRIRNAAKGRVPVKEGIMQKKIKASYSKDGLSASIAPNSPYAHLVEFGTTHSRAKPFMQPTAEEQTPLYVKDMEKALGEAVDAV